MSLPNVQNFGSTLCLFPLPQQVGAPYFHGKDVMDFLIKWGDFTLDWSDDQRIKNIPLYSDELIGRYLKTWPSYTGGDWDEFKDALLEEFKNDDKEQKRNTESYLQCLVQDMQKERGPCLYLHAVGPGNFWRSQWACQMPTETGGRDEGFRYVWFPPAAARGL